MIKNSARDKNYSGFTLIELVIVVGIIAVLSTVVISIVNPTEYFKKARDGQRISDLAAIDRAIETYVSSQANPRLGIGCLDGVSTNSESPISYSLPQTPDPPCFMEDIAEGADVDTPAGTQFPALGTDYCDYGTLTTDNYKKVNGSGWVPVDLTEIPGGSPLQSLPVDPINTVADVLNPKSTDLVYRYVCQNETVTPGKPAFVFEIDAIFESSAYTSVENKAEKDGGDNVNYYEVGSSQRLLGDGTNF